MTACADAGRDGDLRRPARHVHVTQELRDGKLITLQHRVWERGPAEPEQVTTIVDRNAWLALVLDEAA